MDKSTTHDSPSVNVIERRIFYVDVGNMTKLELKRRLKYIKREMLKNIN